MSWEAWKRKIWLWTVPLGFVLLNLFVFVFYHAAYAGRVEELQANHQIASEELESFRERRREVEDFLERAATGDEGVEQLRSEVFASEAERFTRTVSEIKSLARNSGLHPTAFTYPVIDLGEYGLVKRNFEFSVEGTYDKLRTFINFLELTDYFLTLERVSLAKSDEQRDPTLGIRLVLSSIFVKQNTAPGEPRPST